MPSHLLSIILFVPLAGMLILLAMPSANAKVHRLWGNMVCTATFLLSLLLIPGFDSSAAGYQFAERASWIPSIGAQYLLGLDGISLLMVLLTTLITCVASICSWGSIIQRTR